MRTEDSHLAKQAEADMRLPAPAVDPVDQALPEKFPVISVRDEAPALGTARCVTLSAANPVVQILTQDPRRRRAIVLAVDNDVYLARSQELAQAVQGITTGTDAFYLPAGIGIPVDFKASLWAACTTTATSSRVSVLIAKDDE